MKLSFFILFIWAFSPELNAQIIESKPFEYPYNVLVYDLPTASNGINYRLYVRKPLRDPDDGEQASAFYFLDPLRLFVSAAAMSYNYEYFNYIPAAYFIGIGYSNEADGMPKEENRTRDYTPTSFAPPDDTHFLSSNPVDYIGSGGTDAFLKVLENEIIPFVSERFKVSNTDRVLIGNSKSGLAAVHCLLTHPDLFNRYVISSPSIWWDDWAKPRQDRYIMKQVASLSENAYNVENRVYFAVGEAEEGFGMVTDLYVLANALKAKKMDNLKIFLDVLKEEQHEGVFPSAFMKGILGIYADEVKRRPSASPVKWNK
jgi:predicted alpha/beta superfamily hydrolase